MTAAVMETVLRGGPEGLPKVGEGSGIPGRQRPNLSTGVSERKGEGTLRRLRYKVHLAGTAKVMWFRGHAVRWVTFHRLFSVS